MSALTTRPAFTERATDLPLRRRETLAQLNRAEPITRRRSHTAPREQYLPIDARKCPAVGIYKLCSGCGC